MPNSFDKPQTHPAHNSDAEPFFPQNLSSFIEQVSGRDLAMLTESEKEQLAHLIKIGRRYGVSVAIVPDTDSAEIHELLANADSIERQFSLYERIQTKIAFTRCQEA
ncbi:hypothetical protein [Enterobacter kobei]|uniref:hypothetical protein n=1 Tax=Enterobacter kobei TaxID=208224 RepID=UPI0006836507|nr:hypothetical protein [Enterobacter kobei]